MRPLAGSEGALVLEAASVGRRPVSAGSTVAANTQFWDAYADDYQAEHRGELGDVSFLWCPEGVVEDTAGLLGSVVGKSVLEVGCGGAQCARWLLRAGASSVVAFDLSAGQLRHASRLNASSGLHPCLLQASAEALPLATSSVDLACSAFGAIPFIADSALAMREVFRVLRPGGRWVFSVSHPYRWCFADDAGPSGLVVVNSYFDRTPYVESDESGEPLYVEHHRTMGDRLRELVAAGFTVLDIVEPEWPAGHTTTYTQWGEHRGRLIPGTAIWRCLKPAGR